MRTCRLTRLKCKTIMAFVPVLALGVLAFSHVSIAQLTFSAPAALNANAATDSRPDQSPQVTTDGGGNWVAVWESRDNLGGTIGSDFDILVSRSTNDGVTWTTLAALNTNATTDSGNDFLPQITTDGAGNWVAVWESDDDLGGTIGLDGDILASLSTNNGATWTVPAPLNTNATTDSGDDGFSQVTTDETGNWVAVWVSGDDLGGTIGTDSDILVAHSTNNGATWTAPAPLSTNAATDSGDDDWPQITTNGAGNWVAVWSSAENLGGTIGTDGDILVSRSTDNGATWTAPATLNTNAATDSGDDLYPQVTTDGAGNWVGVWTSEDDLGGTIGTDGDILMSRSTDNGATWTAAAPLNTNAVTDSGDDRWPLVRTDPAGNWVTVWQSDDSLGGTIGTDGDILVSYSTDNGATWTAAAPLNTNAATDSGDDERLQLTTDGGGSWVAVWTSEDDLGGTIGTDSDILAATAPAGVDQDVTVFPTSVDFGETSSTQLIRLTNSGTEPFYCIFDTSSIPAVSVRDGNSVEVPVGDTARVFLVLDRGRMEPGSEIDGSISIDVAPGLTDDPLYTLTVPVHAVEPESVPGGGVLIYDISPRSGPTAGGNEVHIYGDNFSSSDSGRRPTVRFGSVAAMVRDWCVSCKLYQGAEAAWLYVLAPPAQFPGPVDVTVTNEDTDESGTDVAGYMYAGGPQLSVTPAELFFDWNVTEAILQISNVGTALLTWEIEIPAGSRLAELVTSVDPSSGSLAARQSVSVRIGVDKSGMEPGEDFTSVLRVTSTEAADVAVPVRILNATLPGIEVEPDPLPPFEGTSGDILTTSFIISNTGQQDLTWSIETYVPQVTISPSSGTDGYLGSTDVQVTVDLTGIPPRTITTKITIHNNAGPDKVMDVTIVVQTPPELHVSPDTVYFDLDDFDVNERFWTKPAIIVSNGGQADLHWNGAPEDTHVVLDPAGGTLGGDASVGVSVTIDTRGLGFAMVEGDTVARTITFSGVHENVEDVDVTVIIERPLPPEVHYVPETLDFGETLNSLSFHIVNTGSPGSAPFEWSWPYTELDGLSLSENEGKVLPGGSSSQIQVTLNRFGLPPVRNLESGLRLVSLDPAYIPPVLPLRFSVPGPVMHVEPRKLQFPLGVDQQQLVISNDYTGILVWQTGSVGLNVTVTPQTGQLTPAPDFDVVTVTVDRTGLTEDTTFLLPIVGNGSVVPVEGERDSETAWKTRTEIIEIEIIVPPPGPRLHVEPTSLMFEQDDILLPLEVTNIGIDILRWDVAVDEPFLTVRPTSGYTERETDIVNVTANRSGLLPGAHTATITLRPLDEHGQPIPDEAISVDVTVIMGAGTVGPYLNVSPSSLRFPLETSHLVLEVRNLGGETLAWSASPQQSYISVAPRSGVISQGMQQVTVTVDRTDMVPGEPMNGSIKFTSNGGDFTVAVIIETVSSGDPVLSVEPLNLAFVAGVRVQSFLIRNVGGGILNWSAEPDPFTASMIHPTDVVPSSGFVVAEPALVVVVADKTAITSTTAGNIKVTATGAGAEEYNLSVTVEPDQAEGPLLQVRPLEVRFPSTQNFGNLMIRNSGAPGTRLDWTLDTSLLPEWVEVNTTAGSTDTGLTDIVRIRIIRQWLTDPGAHRAKLLVQSTGGEAVVVIEATAGEVFAIPTVLTFGPDEDSAILSLHNVGDDSVVWSATIDNEHLSIQNSGGVIEPGTSVDINVTLDHGMFNGSELSGTVTLFADDNVLVIPVRPRVTHVNLIAPEPFTSLDVILSSGASIGDVPLVAETDSVFGTAGVQFKAWVDGHGQTLIGYDNDAPFTAVVPPTMTFPIGELSLSDLVGLDIQLSAVAENRFADDVVMASPNRVVTVNEADPTVVATLDANLDGKIEPDEALTDGDGDGLFDTDRYDFVGLVNVGGETEQVAYTLRTFSRFDTVLGLVAADGTVVDIPAALTADDPVQVLVVTAGGPAALEMALVQANRPTADDAAALADTAANGYGVGPQAGLSCVSVEVVGVPAPLWAYGGVTVGIPYTDRERNGFIDGTTMSIDNVVPTVFADGVDVSSEAVTGFSFDEHTRRGIVEVDRDGIVSLTRDVGQSEIPPDSDSLVDLITMLLAALTGN